MMIPVKGKRVEDVGEFLHDFPGNSSRELRGYRLPLTASG